MPKKFIKRLMPDHRMIREHKYLRIFGTLLHDPNLFHFNRKSASGAFGVGLFWAFIPIPFQMLPAALCAIIFRVNLPLSVALVWLTNPITMPPIFYFCYKVGTWILGVEPQAIHFQVSYEWLMTEMARVWEPFLLGSLICATLAAVLGNAVIRGLWRLHLVQYLKHKKRERELRQVFDEKKE